MKLKLSKLGEVLNVPSLTITGVITALIAFVPQGLGKLSVLLLLVYLLVPWKGKSRYVELNGDEISYICYKAIRSKLEIRFKRSWNHVWGVGLHRTVKVKYRVSNITKFEIRQDFIEKLFGYAHIVFSGENHIDAGKYSKRLLFEDDKHCIRGIVLKKHKQALDDFIKNMKQQ